MAVFNVAGYLIEERRRWPVITASLYWYDCVCWGYMPQEEDGSGDDWRWGGGGLTYFLPQAVG